MCNRGQSNAPPWEVVTTNLAVDAFVPSKVTEDGATVQEAPVGRPEQVNITT